MSFYDKINKKITNFALKHTPKVPLSTAMNLNAGPVRMVKESRRRGKLVKKYGEGAVSKAEWGAYDLGQKKQSKAFWGRSRRGKRRDYEIED
jgi:hypothetical protein